MASKTISISSEDDSQDDDGVWEHKPLKRVKKSSSQYPSSQQQNTSSMSSSRSTKREAGIPHTQSQCYGAGSESAGSGGVTPTIPSSTQGRSLHQSRRKIFDSSQKANKRNSAIKSSQSSAKPKKSGKMSQSQSQTNNDRSHIKTESETNDTEENNQKYCPMCQAPRSSIHRSSLEGHIEDCLEFEKPDIECPDGQFCNVTILNHYQKFSHNVLALTRSEMLPNHSFKMEEDEPKVDMSHLKAEVMTSDSDFERPSSSQFRTRSTVREKYDYKIEGDRVTCTPRRVGSSQVSASQSKPQLKNTARKSLKGVINRSQRNSNRMEAVKEEMPTPRKSENQRGSKAASTRYQENIGKEGNLQCDSHQSSKTPCSQNKTAAKSGSSSRKRRKSAWDDIPESGSILNYFSPSQKTADARLNEAPHSPLPKMKTIPHSAPDSEDSQPFVESDLDIFEEIDNEPIHVDLDCADKSDALTASDKCKDQFTKLKSKQDRTEMPGDLDSLGSDDDKPTDEPLFDILDGLEDTAGEESDSIFSPQSSNCVENTTTSVVNQAKKSNSPNFIDVPPPPVPDNDTSDDELPQFDLTCRSLEDSSDESRDKASNIRPQDSTNDGQCSDGEAMEEGSQDEESESLFNIPGENKQINLPPLVPNEGISAEEESQSLFNIPDQNKEQQQEESQNLFNIPDQNKEQEEESQSLFNIPDQNKEQEEGGSQSLLNIPGQSKEQESLADDFNPGKLHVDNTEVCSENEEEMMDVDDDDDDEEQTNKKEMLGCPAGTMTAKEEASLRPADINTSISAQAVHAKPRKQGNLDSFLGCKPVPAKSRKQGNLDSFLGCKPVPKVESQPQTSKPKGQWRGSKQTSHRSKGEGQERKEWGNNSGKQCPFYKKMPGTSFTVDAFRYGIIPGCKAYFLSHFHYDHYVGLTKYFDQQLYCSKVTGNLVTSRLKVAAKYVINLPMNEPCIIDDVEVTLLDANHCPGSVMFLYKLKSGSIYLHTGDFRADAKMEQYPQLSCCRVNKLYLDTTYCDPEYKFPAQKEVIEFAVQTALSAVSRNKKTLIVCGTYTIGKEKVFRAIAEALVCKVYVESQKFKVLECLEDDELMSLLTRDSLATRLHVIGMNMFNHQKLKEYLSKMSPRYDNILAFKPTGWTHSDKAQSPSDIKPSKSGPSAIYGIPYSEHSSYSEMKRFVQFLRPVQILPTVNNGNPTSRKAMEDIFKRWMEEDGRSSSPTKIQSANIKSWFKK